MSGASDATPSRPARRVPPKSRSQFTPPPEDEDVVDEFDDVAYDNAGFAYGDAGASHHGGHGGGSDSGGGGHGGGH